jgi:predicted NAD/FAD-binding protein
MPRQSIAVVGSGVSGLGAAWLLADRHDVTIYEAQSSPGGHANTCDLPGCPVDTGFIVYNLATYPNFIALLDHLGVATAPSNMTFSVSLDSGAYEYSGNDLAGLIGAPGNLLRPGHWSMVRDILRFFREAEAIAHGGDDVPLGTWLVERGYGAAFIDHHILPMAAAIWSCPAETMLAFPVGAFARFFSHHGLLKLRDRPQWRTVLGGSRNYVRKLLEDRPIRLLCDRPVRQIARDGRSVRIEDATGAQQVFDHVVLATHADTALSMLGEPTARERALLGAFRYQQNMAVLHGDARLMPRRRRLWSSWNYLGAGRGRARRLSVTYWMNSLQPLTTGADVFVTLNPSREPAPERVHGRFQYQHPVFDREAMAAQSRLWELQGDRRTWFCGSYFGYGFHEDGLQSGLAVAEELAGVRRPWRVAQENGRVLALAGSDGRIATLEAA